MDDSHCLRAMPVVDRWDEAADDRVTYGRWVRSTVDVYWRRVHSDLHDHVYASCTRPGDRIVTAWCDRITGVPTVGAVDLWVGGVRLPSEFFVFDPEGSD